MEKVSFKDSTKKFLYTSLAAVALLTAGGAAATFTGTSVVNAATAQIAKPGPVSVSIWAYIAGSNEPILVYSGMYDVPANGTFQVKVPAKAGYTSDRAYTTLTTHGFGQTSSQSYYPTYTKISGSKGGSTASNADSVVYINKAGGAKVYSDQATTNATYKTLGNTTAWKFFSVVKDSAGKIVAYNLGGKQYVKAAEVSTSRVNASVDVFTVHYPVHPKWSIAVYNSDLKVQKLIPAGSRWRTFGTKTLKDGKSYYNLGGNQWVRTYYGF